MREEDEFGPTDKYRKTYNETPRGRQIDKQVTWRGEARMI